MLCKQGAFLEDAEARKYGIVDGRLSALMPADDPRAKKQIAKNLKAEPAVKEAIIEDPEAKRIRLKTAGDLIKAQKPKKEYVFK